MANTGTEVRTYSEVEAARALNVPRSTLRLWRTSGKIAASVFATVAPRNTPGRTATPVNYDADAIDKIAAGAMWPEVETVDA